ncbi:MAG: ABC transporter ATP-binding protein [Phycisphaera sp.]|nr:MAG: ABC transporter ATP-binding protein [Phycisphaera sp.]
MVGNCDWLVRISGGVVEHRARRSKTIRALDNVEFTVAPGDSVALLGPNGSGKSTLLRAIMGVQRLASGSIERDDHLRLGVVFQSPALDPLLTVRENLRLQAALFGIADTDERIERLCADQAIDDRLGDRVRTLSGGLARRVEFVRAILAEPDLLLLDEPTVGLDLPSRAALLGALDSLRAQRPDVAVVMSTHLMTDAERFDRVAMMSAGRFVCEGSPRELVDELGTVLLGVPAEASIEGGAVPWEMQADGSRLAKPADEAQLAEWSAELVAVGAPFFVRKPTLADAYLHRAQSPLEAEVPS